jgi:hypothetical protein
MFLKTPHLISGMSGTTRETGLGALGPYYDFTNELKYPSEFLNNRHGSMRDGDIFSGPGQMEKNVRGLKYYTDSITFGTSVGPTQQRDELKQAPMGLNYFFNTGMQCSNGADMYQYMSTIPTGLPFGLGNGLTKKLGANLQGLAPGVLQDSFDAMNPVPMFNAVMGSGFAKCKLMEAPVGDANGKLKSRFPKPVPNADPTGSDNPEITEPNIWVDPKADKVYYKTLPRGDGSVYVASGPQPHMRRWVLDKWISEDEYNWTQSQLKQMGRLYTSKDIPDIRTPNDPEIPVPPTENEIKAALQAKATEGFRNHRYMNPQFTAGILFATLFLGLVAFTAVRK